MSDYNNKKKYKKKKTKERIREARAKRRGNVEKEKNREEKMINKIQWQNRSRIRPLRKETD